METNASRASQQWKVNAMKVNLSIVIDLKHAWNWLKLNIKRKGSIRNRFRRKIQYRCDSISLLLFFFQSRQFPSAHEKSVKRHPPTTEEYFYSLHFQFLLQPTSNLIRTRLVTFVALLHSIERVSKLDEGQLRLHPTQTTLMVQKPKREKKKPFNKSARSCVTKRRGCQQGSMEFR